MTRPPLTVTIAPDRTQRVGALLLQGTMRIVDASERGAPPNGALQMATTIFAGRNVYDTFAGVMQP